MSNITYTVPDFDQATATSVEVTYTNTDTGFVHKRTVNVPRKPDGSGEFDAEYFTEILEGQLRGVENKLNIGVIAFTDPNVEPEPNESPLKQPTGEGDSE